MLQNLPREITQLMKLLKRDDHNNTEELSMDILGLVHPLQEDIA